MMRNGRCDTCTGIWQDVVPKESLISKHNLYGTSFPANWCRAFLPNEKKRNEPLSFCTNDWTMWKNIRATLANAVHKNNLYPTFVPGGFTYLI